ncbi:MAG: DUF192 domain-containing protein [Candidatus Pacebacteria bacterium]|nr:DUF192 domain-containing protein [Candidatus Paceibacterota bacterium]
MQRRTTILLGLLLAAIVILGYVWYVQPQAASVPVFQTLSVADATTTSTVVATTSAQTGEVGSTRNTSLYPAPSLGEHTGSVQLKGQTIYVDLAQNPEQQELGLGNRTSLGADQGMLFIFPDDADHLFWMKDMSFSIDMIWLSADGTVIYIQPDVAPNTYPQAFGPDQASRYVLEVPARYAQTHGIKVGDQAILP